MARKLVRGSSLTEDDHKMMSALASGMRLREYAEQVHLSLATVNNKRDRIVHILGANSLVQAMHIWTRQQQVSQAGWQREAMDISERLRRLAEGISDDCE